MSWLDDFFSTGPQGATGPTGPQGPSYGVTGTGLVYSSSSTLHGAAVTFTGDISAVSLSGNNLPITVTAIQGNAVSNNNPAAANLLVWQTAAGGSWVPVAMSGDVSITSLGAAKVLAIQNNTVTSGALVKGNLLIATSTSNWASTAVTGDVAFSTSTPGATTVGALQAFPVSNATPTASQFLFSNGSTWAPSSVVSGSGLWYQASGSIHSAAIALTADVFQGALSGNNVPLTVVRIQTIPVSSTTPTAGQVLVFNSPDWTPTSFSADVSLNASGQTYVCSISGANDGAGTIPMGNGVTNLSFLQDASTQLTPPTLSYTASAGYSAASVSGAGAAYNIKAGAGTVASSGTAAGGAGGPLNLSSGAGAAGLGSNQNGGNGGTITLNAMGGGAATGSGVAGSAGEIILAINSLNKLTIDHSITTASTTTFSLGAGISNVVVRGTPSAQSTPPTLILEAATGYSAASVSGAGAAFSVIAGSATIAGSGSAAGGVGGQLNLTAGSGAEALGSGNGGVGGNVVISAGLGGENSSHSSYALGGALQFWTAQNGVNTLGMQYDFGVTVSDVWTLTLGYGSEWPVVIQASTGIGAQPGLPLSIVGSAGYTPSSGNGYAGGAVDIIGGIGGAAQSGSATGGPGAPINITGGAGAESTGTAANANGGNVVISGGAAGIGGSGSAGTIGLVQVVSQATFSQEVVFNGSVLLWGNSFPQMPAPTGTNTKLTWTGSILEWV